MQRDNYIQFSAQIHYQTAKSRTTRNGERVDNSLSGREALGNEQREAAERTRTHQQQMIFRFLAHSLTPFGHETAASVTG
ncbi:TPA: hypothetical protein SHS77_005874 [Raoultella planticola]|jgi:hypothetical protein|nr:hypothetical protein [Raoultella planticola]